MERLSIFLKNRSLSNARLFQKEKLYSIENLLSRNKMWCTVDNHNNICNMCKRTLRLKL